jgi:hypothetical protein
MDNIYVVGHGFMIVTNENKPEKIDLKIPVGINVRFYCKEYKAFDSTWEKHIVDNKGILPDSKVPSHFKNGRDDWSVKQYPNLNSTAYEHLLVRPGHIFLYKEQDEMKKIVPDDKGTVSIEKFCDGDTLYIGGDDVYDPNDVDDYLKKHSCRLSALLEALDAQQFKGNLHWLACRNEYDEFNKEMSKDLADEACKTIYHAPADMYPTATPQKTTRPPNAHNPTNSSNPPIPSVLSYPDSWASKFPSANDDSDGGLSD